MNRSKSPAPRRGTEPDAEQDGEGWLLWLLSILLVILVVAVFGQTARFGFINFDDDQYVTGSALTQLGLSAEGVRSAWTSSQVGNWHPLTTWSFMLDWQLFGMKASGYHLHNVLLHAGATVLLFLALCRMTRALWLSALVAVIFAIHPLRAESVAWVSERKDVLSGFYFMLTLWAYAVYVSQPSMLRYLAVLVFFVLGLMCKAMLVTLPVVLLLLDYWPLRRFETGEEAHAEQPGGALETPRVVIQRMLGLVREKWLLFVLAGVFSVVTARLSLDADRSEKVLDLSVRLAMAPVTYVTYLGKMLYPVHLSVHYPYAVTGPPGWQVLGAGALLGAISLGAWLLRSSSPWILVGWVWYLIMALPIIGLIPGGNQLVADRYTYLTQIGLSVALVWVAGGLYAGWSKSAKSVARVGVMALILLLFLLCWRQTSFWRDSETLWRHALAATSDNAVAHEKLGSVFGDQAKDATVARDFALARAKNTEAKNEYLKALALAPERLPSLCNLGGILSEEGKSEQAIALYERAAKVNPRVVDVHYNVANALLKTGAVEAAIASYRSALEVAPDHALSHNNLANTLDEKGRHDEAVMHYRLAIRSQPQHVQAYNNLSNTLIKQGKLEEAAATLLRALEISPVSPSTLRNLGSLSSSMDDFQKAQYYYRRALQQDADDFISLNNLGDLLNQQGDVEGAVAAYQQGVTIAPEHPILRYNLGYCLARSGREKEALETYQKALALAEAQKNAAAAAMIGTAIQRLKKSPQ